MPAADGRRVAAMVAALAALVLAAPAGAGAITKTQADAVALQVLNPQAEAGDVVVLGLPKPVKPGAVVTEYGKAGLLKKRGQAAWLYWEDLAPGAMFEHASRALVIDDETGRVLADSALSYYPLVDGKPPAYLRSGESYFGTRYQVFSKVAALPPPRRAAPRAARSVSAIPPGSLAGDCLLMLALTPGNQMEASNALAALKAWNGLAQSVGVPAYVGTAQGPVSTKGLRGLRPPPYKGQVSDATIGRDVSELVDSEGCTDIAIYILGHGTPPEGWTDPEGRTHPGGPATITMGVQPLPKKDVQAGKKPGTKTLTPNGIAEAVEASKDKATFKFVIEACFAERFDDLSLEPRVKTVIGSSAPDQYSVFNLNKSRKYANVKPAVSNPSEPEFTHGMTLGFAQTIADDAEVKALAQKGDSLFARLLGAAFAKEKPNDRGALAGTTAPSEVNNLTGPQASTCGTWEHRGATSTLEVFVSTKPPVPGGRVSWRVIAGGTGVISNGTGSGALGADGKTEIDIEINKKISYDVEVTVKSADGSEVLETEVVHVEVKDGAGPACS